ncbi:hypothetical protein OAN13_04695 [Opitutales bacterium]|nr:hypothetical protein [Opitutales bacterium]
MSEIKIFYFQTSDSTSTTVTGGAFSIDSNESLEIFTTKIEYESQNYMGGVISLQVQNADGSWVSILGKENLKTDQKLTIPGPCDFRFSGKSYSYSPTSKMWVRMNVFANLSPKEKEAPSLKFATVIPENSENNVSIVLEQSTDLINWTSATPGVFAPSTSKRFFRVRSEEE